MKVYEYWGAGYGEASKPLFGTEYEIEAIKPGNIELGGDWAGMEVDNSLRNNGMEFKTRPVTYERSLELFKNLHKALPYKASEAFSDRTSIHVHLNVADMDVIKAKEFVLLYAMLEPLFFNFVVKSRQNNIYCVPLNFTHLTSHYHKDFKSLVNVWHKYTAFNILPVKNLGTIEFRHLQGTNHYETYHKWLTAIRDLHKFVQSESFFILQFLLKNGDVKKLAKDVVPTLCEGVTLTDEMFYDSLLDVKLAKGALK